MIRVLHIFHEMANGGIEHFVMDHYRHLDRSRVQFDFLVSVEAPGFFDKEIQSLGGKIYHAYPLKKDPIRNYHSIAQIVRENHYDIVHRHTGSAFGYFDLRAARSGGAKHLILHSHNNQAGNMALHKVSNLLLKIPCQKFACSQEAGKWLFGKNAEFRVIKNAVDCDKFAFHQEVRDSVRSNINLTDKFVIGHVGRFETQKNHIRLMHMMKAITAQNADCVLVCVGTGSLQKECMEEAERLGIADHVQFLGTRSDIPQLMHAFDVFLLPSLYEGLPFVLVEAQANGLPCVVSTHVPRECNITGNVQFMDLENSDQMWANRVLEAGAMKIDRESFSYIMRNSGFDITRNANMLCEYYESLH